LLRYRFGNCKRRESWLDREKLQERLAKLVGGVAVNAASISGLLLTTEAIAEIPEKKEAHGGGHSHGGGMDGMY
jgi:hypothetical protein